MSDLHCPAMLLVADEASPAADLAAAAAARRVTRVYAAHPDAPGAAVAETLGVDLAELDLGGGGGQDPAFEEIADQHRGETVIALVPADMLVLDGVAAQVEIDADGWRVSPWAVGVADRGGSDRR